MREKLDFLRAHVPGYPRGGLFVAQHVPTVFVLSEPHPARVRKVVARLARYVARLANSLVELADKSGGAEALDR